MKFNIIILVVILGILAALIIPINAAKPIKDEPLKITTWSNNKTDSKSTNIKINISEGINFNATANQAVDFWNWTRDGVEQGNNFDNFSTFWDDAGIKAVSVNATNDNGTDTITWKIMVNPPEIISWGNNKTNNNATSLKINVSEPINFNISTDQAITTWNWYRDGFEQVNNFDNFSTSWDSEGTKTVSVNATNDNGTTETITWEITINPLPEIVDWNNNKTLDATLEISILTYESINFNATADQPITRWNWYIDNVEQGNNFDNFTTSWDAVASRTIEVNATNENGTSNTVTWNITVEAPEEPPSTDHLEIITWSNNKTNDGSTLIKINISEAINFNATANQAIDTWNWTRDGDALINDFDNFSTSWDTAGIKTVSVNATNNTNTSNTITWEIMVDPPEIISWNNTKTNNNATSLKINVSEPINFNISTDQAITTWNWTRDGDVVYNNFDNFSTSWDTKGTKKVSVNATNDNGTTETITWVITINPPEIVGYNNKTSDATLLEVLILTNESINFSATADQPITRWNWYKDGVEQGNDFDNFTTSWEEVGVNRTVELNATNENGTSNTVTWNITVKAPVGRPPSKGRDQDEDIDLGEVLGDLYVILRDDYNGVPILDDNGCIIPLDENGDNLTMIWDTTLEIYCEISDENQSLIVPVEFGRLAIARSPPVVLDASFDEAITALNNALEINLDASGRFLLTKEAINETGVNYTYEKPIDSSLENLALYKKLMLDGNLLDNLGDYDHIDLGDPVADPILRPTLNVTHFNEVTNDSLYWGYLVDDELDENDLLRSASFLAAAADKTGHIEVDMVVYLNTIMGLNADLNGNDTLEPEEYVNFSSMNYNRKDTYLGDVLVLQKEMESTGNGLVPVPYHWVETEVTLCDLVGCNDQVFTFDEPGDPLAQYWIGGFVQAADDALRVIHFVHTYQIPSLR